MYAGAHLNLGVLSAPKGHPFLLEFINATVAESRTAQSDAAWMNASFDFYTRMERDTKRPLAPGTNRNARRPGLDYKLLREDCQADRALCGGRLDQKLGLCCIIFDGDTPAFMQRDPDYPNTYPWGGGA